jgi:HEAT repeat protein
LAAGLTSPIAALLDHPLPRVRAAALSFLGGRDEPAARQAVLRALGDTDPQLQQTALHLAARWGSAQVAAAVAKLLGDRSWSTRAKAARALGEMSRAASDKQGHPLVVKVLGDAALNDDYALVRQAALEGLSRFDRKAAGPVLRRALQQDPEARVRELARNLLGGQPAPAP